MAIGLRAGQSALKELLESEPDRVKAVCQFPTGYGKTLCIGLAYSIRRMQRICDRLLVVVANDPQLCQAMHAIPQALVKLGAKCGSVRKFTDEPHMMRSWMDGEIEVVVTTIQMVHSCYRKPENNLARLLSRGNWMLAADEFHHYGEDLPWGTALRVLTDHGGCQFRLALSATPDRDGTPTIFGPVTPGLRVSYRDGIREQAVKPLQRRKYEYVMKLCDGRELRTSEVKNAIAQYGDFTEYELKSRLRYNADYCTPLIREPAERLIRQRQEMGQRVQMLVRALSCRHAKYVAESLGIHFKGLSVDWIGGGENGREDAENKEIIAKFKPVDGSEPTLDVLVQVGMASEGFDSVLVTEIVDFQIVTLEGAANQTKQFIGRGSRVIPGCEGIPCYVNVGTDHPIALAQWSLNDWIDSGDTADLPAVSDDGDEDRQWYEDWEYVPENLDFQPILDSVELHHIDVESEDFKMFTARAAVNLQQELDINDPDTRVKLMQAYLDCATEVNRPLQEEAARKQADDAVKAEMKKFARLVIKRKLEACDLPREERDAYARKIGGKAKHKASAQLIKVFGNAKSAMKAAELREQAELIQQWCMTLNNGGSLPWL